MINLKVLMLVGIFCGIFTFLSAEDETSLQSIQSGIEKFTINIFKLFYDKTRDKKNLICSPFNIYLAIAEVALGSEGETQKQTERVMGVSDINNTRQVHGSIKTIQEIVENVTEGTIVDIMNGIFIQKPLQLKTKFRKNVKYYYQSVVKDVDFQNNGGVAKDEINRFISNSTRGLIPNLFPQPLPPQTRLLLVETLYFKGNWSKKFNKQYTKNETFHSGSESIPIKMMSKTSCIPYINYCWLRAEIIQLDYQGNEVTIFFLRPHNSSSLSELVRNLRLKNLRQIIRDFSSLQCTEVNYLIPRVENEWDSEINTSLQALNLTLPFTNGAQIKMIRGEPLKIDQVNHAAKIKIDEYGTEAAAVTTITLRALSLQHSPTVTFRLDVPFLYFIYHSKAEVILFIGTVVNPNGNKQQ